MCSPLSSKTHTSVYALTVQSLVNLRWAAWKKQQEELFDMSNGKRGSKSISDSGKPGSLAAMQRYLLERTPTHAFTYEALENARELCHKLRPVHTRVLPASLRKEDVSTVASRMYFGPSQQEKDDMAQKWERWRLWAIGMGFLEKDASITKYKRRHATLDEYQTHPEGHGIRLTPAGRFANIPATVSIKKQVKLILAKRESGEVCLSPTPRTQRLIRGPGNVLLPWSTDDFKLVEAQTLACWQALLIAMTHMDLEPLGIPLATADLAYNDARGGASFNEMEHVYLRKSSPFHLRIDRCMHISVPVASVVGVLM
jgi:hypothetical protein